jgi:methylenetetrahydrofolate dehydrogenase (NADP+)/methenyltetrahydrofolate cyclohydrolase
VLDEDGNPVLNDKGKPKSKTVGDVQFDTVKEKAGMITPVPGGVGAITNMMLMRNTIKAARIQNGLL